MKPQNNRPLALVILDGWGISELNTDNAIALAHTPNYDEICSKYPWVPIAASGQLVGLPDGVAGNAELGHMHIGAGRVVKTDTSRISSAIKSGDFFENPALSSAFGSAASRNAPVHLIGLLSDGDVHSSSETLYALLRMARKLSVQEVFVHCILDGRDVPPRSADIYVEALEIKMADIGVGRIATLCGRFFAMDSSENWERTARAFTMLVHAEGERAFDAGTAIRSSFLRGISDEFVAPVVLEREEGVPVATIKTGDVVVFFNHRSDTMRQLARSLAVPDRGQIAETGKPRIEAVCLTEYDRSFELPVAFSSSTGGAGLAHVFADFHVPNYRISEPDRFPHVTDFFNGNTDVGSFYEQHVIVPSGSSNDREAEPEMKSFKITDKLLHGMDIDENGIFVVNIPAPGLVAETGNLERAVEAVQYVDTCLSGIVNKIRSANGIAIVTSTHGNCESMIDKFTNQPDRSATSNSVPFHIIGEGLEQTRLRQDGALSDVAPTILGLLGIDKPSEMSGTDLRIS
ncbi:MAG: 2,3-bisphosphoglycerate-independent phosphoglycerate mutase [Blastocatellia bacterium]